jgi:DNA-binding transcriptional LysR family regulator
MSLLSPQLEAFVAIAKHKTVHAAAHAIQLTQTAVTQRIRGLEAKLSTTLFIRSRRGMLLTPEGTALLRYCHAAQELEGEALAKIQGAAVAAEIQVTITGSTSIMQSRIIPECLTVMKKFPNLLMRFAITDIENRHLALRSGDCDFAIIHPEHVAQEMEFKVLEPEKYILVCSANWKNRKLTEIIQTERIIDFNPSDQMTFNYLKQFDLFDLAQHGRHFVNRTESLTAMVIAGMGYTTLPKQFAQPYVEKEQLYILNSGKIYKHPFVLAWYSRPEPAAYFSALIDAIR